MTEQRLVRSRVSATAALVALVVSSLAAGAADAAGDPRGVHVSFGADPRTSATITWFTDGADDPGTVVEYGLDETLGSSAGGTAQRAPGTGYPSGVVLVHEVLLQDLPAGALVHYRAGSPAAWTPIRSFRLAPADGDRFRFTAFADHGVEPASVKTTEAVIAAAPDFHVIAGDLSYAQPSTPTFPEFPKWDTWFDQMEPLWAETPVMVALGNHECESIGCAASYRARLALPGDELLYSFDYLNVHFLVMLSDLSTVVQERRPVDPWTFAEADLAQAALRKRNGEIDWIVVVQHHPLYGSQPGEPHAELLERRYNPRLIALEERLLHLYDVDVLLVGHNHHYQRSKPMAFGVATTDETSTYRDPDGFVQVITGGAGQGLRGMLQPGDQPKWSAAAAVRFHFTQFEVEGKTLRARAIATDGNEPAVIDEWSITRS